MRVYMLQFATRSELSRAFDRILDDDEVSSCMIDMEIGRLRFLAPPEHADDLVERIYMDGGLTWCSRHDIGSATDRLRPTRAGASG